MATAPAASPPTWSIAPSQNPPGPPSASSARSHERDELLRRRGLHVPEYAEPHADPAVERHELDEHDQPLSGERDRREPLGCCSASATNCFAVGSYNPSGGTFRALIQRWNGTAWSIVASPTIPGSTADSLVGVSCVTAPNCFAVGSFDTAGVTKTLIERWNGAVWSVVGSPNPAGENTAFLNDVECASATSCFAVGVHGNDDFGLIERWNGGAWSIVSNADPAGTTDSYLSGVTCTSTTNCFAVGDYETSTSFRRSLIKRWNGASWVVVASPNVASSHTSLSSVDCVSTTFCIAVGESEPDSGSQPEKTVIERWNGSAWSIVSSPNRPDAPTAAT